MYVIPKILLLSGKSIYVSYMYDMMLKSEFSLVVYDKWNNGLTNVVNKNFKLNIH